MFAQEVYQRSFRKSIGEALASKFELEFTLIACMAITIMGSVCYLNSGASFHMKKCKEFFSGLVMKPAQEK